MGRLIAIIIVAAIVIFGIVWLLGLDRDPGPAATSTPVVIPTTPESPSNGVVYENADASKIQVVSPQPHSTVPPTFTLTGQARGPWYFEASFPIEILDAKGMRILQMPVQAQGEWMTTEFVPFSTQIDVGTYRGPAILILHKDNPSGLSEHDARVSIPIVIQ